MQKKIYKWDSNNGHIQLYEQSQDNLNDLICVFDSLVEHSLGRRVDAYNWKKSNSHFSIEIIEFKPNQIWKRKVIYKNNFKFWQIWKILNNEEIELLDSDISFSKGSIYRFTKIDLPGDKWTLIEDFLEKSKIRTRLGLIKQK